MFKRGLQQTLFLLHALSMDVALGACAMLHAGSAAVQISIPSIWYVLLSMGTLVVYWLDHLIDVRVHVLASEGRRHKIFQQHKPLMHTATLLLIGVAALLAFRQLTHTEIKLAAMLCLGMGVYLGFHRQFSLGGWLPKEVQVTLLYVASVTAPVFILSNRLSFPLIGVAMVLFLAVLQNLLSMAVIDNLSDQEAGIRNITHHKGIPATRTLQTFLLLAQSILLLSQPFPLAYKFFFTGLTLLQYALPQLSQKIGKEPTRQIGEAGFVLGVLV